MSRTLQRLSAILFYLLAGSFFLGYLLARNSVFLPWSEWWLKVADLPLVLVAILYGGSSLYTSVHRKEHISWLLLVCITIPLSLLFIALVILNFWDILGLPQGPGA
jgi:hypothetical protein